MRISTDTGCLDYRPDAHKFDVYLDGVKIHDAITADDSRGKVTVYARDEAGKLISDGYGQLKRKVLAGVVTFEPRPGRASPASAHHESPSTAGPEGAAVNPHCARNSQALA